MKEYGMKYKEDLDEEDDSTETIELALEEFDNTSQYRGKDFGICVDVFEMNERQYSI